MLEGAGECRRVQECPGVYKRRAPLLRLRGLGKSIRTDLLNPLNQRSNSSVAPPPSRPRSKGPIAACGSGE
jgi:hypothetical protein